MTTYGNVVNDNQKQLMVPVNLQISFIVSAFLGLISHWLEDEMIYTSRYMTQSTEKMFDTLNREGAPLVDFFGGEKESVLEEI